ncbi:hypothetical protein Tco_0984076 [Tanacetum coccineum]
MDPFDVAQKPLLYVQLALKRLLLVEVVELFQVFQLELLCTFSIFYSLMIWPSRPDHDISLMIWPGRPNHDIEGWDIFSKKKGDSISSSNPFLEDAVKEEIRLVENLLYDKSSPRPPKELNLEIADTIFESLSPSPILVEDSDSLMEEIDLFLASDDSMPPGIEDDDYDSEGDIRFLEELLNNDSLPLPEFESFHFDPSITSSPPNHPRWLRLS